MTSDDPRPPEYDPESVGLPDTFDPDSTAFDENESVREADGPDPVLWPDDRPLALDEYGLTVEAGTLPSLDDQLARETPDVGAGDEPDLATADTENTEDADDEFADDTPRAQADDNPQTQTEYDDETPDPYADDEAEDADGFRGALQDDEVSNPYEEEDPVGRLADDERSDLNDRSFAQDVGMAGGGSSAEESAMHIIADEDQELDF